jgi:hypothetical protein
VYRQWAALDQYGMFAIFGVFILFNAQISQILLSAFENVVRGISAIVGGTPLI